MYVCISVFMYIHAYIYLFKINLYFTFHWWLQHKCLKSIHSEIKKSMSEIPCVNVTSLLMVNNYIYSMSYALVHL